MPAFMRLERTSGKDVGMRICWHFMGRALPFAERLHLPEPEQMQLGGLLLVPSAGDQVVMITKEDATHVYLKCEFRRFDLTSIDGPVVNVHLKLAS
jgi:hypothetical protein